MKRSMTFLFAFILVFALAGCESKAEKDRKVQQDLMKGWGDPGAPSKKGSIFDMTKTPEEKKNDK